MRIFYASDTTPNSALDSNLWRNNLYLPLVDLGHDIVEFKYDLRTTFQNLDPRDPIQERFILHNRPKVTKELLRQIKEAHKTEPIDLFFSYFYDACVLPEAIEEIKSMGIKTVNWYCNGSYQLHLVAEISPYYDYCLVPEKFRLPDYKALGARAIYCQEAANPNIYKPYDLQAEYDVTFVGQAYGERPEYIKFLYDQGIDVRVWGFGWNNYSLNRVAYKTTNPIERASRIARKLMTVHGWRLATRKIKNLLSTGTKQNLSDAQPIILPSSITGGTLSDIELIQMYSSSKINLGFSSVGNTHQEEERIVQIRLRDFEVPMSGGFYMVEYMEELEEFFDIGKEIICYSGREDLADKIKYYLKHDSEREKIRQAGYKRAQNDHTWHKRFINVFKEIGLE